MPVETFTTIAGLNELWPLGTDPKSAGDDHLRGIKAVLKADAVSKGQLQASRARNRLINPCFQHSQENVNTGGTTFGYYAADQWFLNVSTTGTMTLARVQSVTPNGSLNRLRLTVTAADTSLAAGEYCAFHTRLEGIKVADFRWGTASAKQVVIRFGWKSPAGTYSIFLQNSNASRSYIATFTIAAGQANTDTEQLFVVPGDSAGAWLTDNGIGVQFGVAIGAGASLQGAAGWQAGNVFTTSAVGNGLATLGAAYELFDCGLYLDVGATGAAPTWEMPDEAAELLACQRYYFRSVRSSIGYNNGGSLIGQNLPHPVVMRVTPSLSPSGGTFTNCTGPNLDLPNVYGCRVLHTIGATGTGYADQYTEIGSARM